MGKHLLRLGALGILVVAGCKDDGGSSAVGPVPEDQAPETAVNVICAQFESCECDPANAAPDGCEASIDEQVRQAQGDATAAGLEYDADCMGRYLSAYRELGCRTIGDFTLEELVALGRKYDCKVFFGEDEPGEACEAIELGDSCVAGAQCLDALCVAITDPAAEGEECNTDVDLVTACVTGTYCIDIDGDERATCVRLPESGEACLGSLQLCDLGLACNDGTCLTAPGDGEDCHLGGLSPCAEGLECDFETIRCRPLPEGGELCSGSCADGFTCTDGRCVALEPIVCDPDVYSQD